MFERLKMSSIEKRYSRGKITIEDCRQKIYKVLRFDGEVKIPLGYSLIGAWNGMAPEVYGGDVTLVYMANEKHPSERWLVILDGKTGMIRELKNQSRGKINSASKDYLAVFYKTPENEGRDLGRRVTTPPHLSPYFRGFVYWHPYGDAEHQYHYEIHGEDEDSSIAESSWYPTLHDLLKAKPHLDVRAKRRKFWQRKPVVIP